MVKAQAKWNQSRQSPGPKCKMLHRRLQKFISPCFAQFHLVTSRGSTHTSLPPLHCHLVIENPVYSRTVKGQHSVCPGLENVTAETVFWRCPLALSRVPRMGCSTVTSPLAMRVSGPVAPTSSPEPPRCPVYESTGVHSQNLGPLHRCHSQRKMATTRATATAARMHA